MYVRMRTGSVWWGIPQDSKEYAPLQELGLIARSDWMLECAILSVDSEATDQDDRGSREVDAARSADEGFRPNDGRYSG